MERWLTTVTVGAGTLAGFLLYSFLRRLFKKVIVYDYQHALLYKNGAFTRKLPAGAHWLWTPSDTISQVDGRRNTVTISGQEIVTADNVGIKLSLLISYRVVDAEKALNQTASWYQDLYALAQLTVRDRLSNMKVDEILQTRSAFGDELLAELKSKAGEIGVELLLLQIKDIILPAEIRKIYGDVLRAQKEGLAALERARGEQAALRSLANAARVLEGNPALMNLRVLQALSGTGGNTPPTVVLSLPPGMPPFHFPAGPPPPPHEGGPAHRPPHRPGPMPQKPPRPEHGPAEKPPSVDDSPQKGEGKP